MQETATALALGTSEALLGRLNYFLRYQQPLTQLVMHESLDVAGSQF